MIKLKVGSGRLLTNTLLAKHVMNPGVGVKN